MIVADGSPFLWGPRSVAHVLRAWCTAWPVPGGLRVLWPAPSGGPAGIPPGHVLRDTRASRSPRRFRARLPALVRASGADAFLSPWTAFPDPAGCAVPVAVSVHELPWVRHGTLEGRVRGLRHERWLRRAVREAAALIVPSEATRADLRALHPGAAGRVHVVPPGFDPAPWQAARRAPEQPPYAVMVGQGHGRRGARKKGRDVLLAAWRRAALPDWRLWLVGAPLGELGPHVLGCGDLEDAELGKLVAGASLLVHPARSEGFGLPPLEAMAAGVPVLTTDAGSLPEVVGDAASVVPAGDVDALAAALGRLASDEALRATLRARGARRAQAFSPQSSAARVAEILARTGEPA